MKGIVLWYDIRKGYGFIRGINGKDVFVHKTAIPFWNIYLTKGNKVEFSIKNSKRGINATNIKVL